MKMKEVDIVIISWAKNKEFENITKRGIVSLYKSEPNIKFNTFVIESNAKVDYSYLGDNIKTIYPNTPFGYHRYLNIGIKSGKSKYVALCNNDLTYGKKWASEIIAAMDKKPYLLSASPRCPQTQGSSVSKLGNVQLGRRIRKELAGWCIFQKRIIYEKIGKLDEQFEFWYCDNDYGMTLEKNNILHGLICSSIVNHHEKGMGKTGSSIDKNTKKRYTTGQGSKFFKKWGVKKGPLK